MEVIVKYSGDILSLDLPTDILGNNCAIILADEQELLRIEKSPIVEYWEPAEYLSPFLLRKGLGAACISPVQRPSGFSLTGNGTLVGIIDSGIDLRHPEFLNPDGTTRVAALWDMTRPGQPPPGFHKGTVYTARDIRSGAVTSGDPGGHGTAVAAIAAGKNGAAPGSSLLIVRMGGGQVASTDIMRGLRWIISTAQSMNMPCAVNLSYGTNLGSHRGQSLFETYIDAVSLEGKSVIVCASGNEGSGVHHFEGTLLPGETVPVEFNVSTRRETLYLTLWKSFVDEASYELILPSGRSTGPLLPSSAERRFSFGDIGVSVLFSGPTHYSTAQQVFFRITGPSGKMDGLWLLRCYGINVVDGGFDLWLPTAEEVGEDTAFLRPQPDLTITLPATARSPISTGGYRTGTDTISPFSGRGDRFCRGRGLLDLAAPAENILSAKSGGGYDSFSGTSMAAPFVTGSAALMMEWGIVRGYAPYLYGQQVKAYLCKNALRSPFLSYPNPKWGYGKLSLCRAMADLESRRKRGA